VTHNDPEINGQKPNCPSEGDQSVDLIKDQMEWVFKSGSDFMMRPVPMPKGNIRQIDRQANIHFEEMCSFIFRDILMKYSIDIAKLFCCQFHELFIDNCLWQGYISCSIDQFLSIR